MGANVGHEEDGKGDRFARPVLVVKKFNRQIFWGVPLSTQLKDKFYYHRIYFHDKPQSAMLSQLKLFSTKRLTTKMGQLDDIQFNQIRENLKSYLKNYSAPYC